MPKKKPTKQKESAWRNCPNCDSSYSYHRMKDNVHVCRKCGNEYRVNWTTKTVRSLPKLKERLAK